MLVFRYIYGTIIVTISNLFGGIAMSQFGEFNAENKLRIPLSAFAAQVIESDCFSFSKKKTTLINAVILNSYQNADCSISIRLKEYREELLGYSASLKLKGNDELVEKIITGKRKELEKAYAKRYPSDVNWQITLSKRVKELLTEDLYTAEELYYGQKPGHYVRALIEEYALKPYYMREEIVFKPIFDSANMAIDGQYILSVTNHRGNHFTIKPYGIKSDPLSMFHYLIGYNAINVSPKVGDKYKVASNVLSFRMSRLDSVEIQYLSSGKLTAKELDTIENEIEKKGVQFVTSEKSIIKVWLSDAGIKRYESQAHLRPPVSGIDHKDPHIYCFECTDAQILFYFFEFGKDAKIISPSELSEKFKTKYKDAYDLYN